jgi:hypothetical protein
VRKGSLAVGVRGTDTVVLGEQLRHMRLLPSPGLAAYSQPPSCFVSRARWLPGLPTCRS